MSDTNSSIMETIRLLLIEGQESDESKLSIDDIIEMEFPLREN